MTDNYCYIIVALQASQDQISFHGNISILLANRFAKRMLIGRLFIIIICYKRPCPSK